MSKKNNDKQAPPPAYPGPGPAPGYMQGAQQPYPGAYQAPPGYPAQPPPYSQGVPGPAGYRPPPPGAGYAPYMAQPQQQPYYPGQYQQGPPQPRQNVIVQGGFDAGARFDGISQPNIPPPPPGCAPNAAQMAAAQGHNVSMSQRPGSFWTGGSDGGSVWW